ncbi:preprotein translocase subunit SecG [Geobacter hydrogenophilus]|uniref:Protein-export membrane protein SecG n=1 Tax=Geobacter hydrogenophilus TaxID=40983 RepID=A0A9W6FX84_9BACT|nr:preprotein translocase subunit SecG [Geobacter hydrogenophilus]MBT0895242.1 preprotein translocase subunit SecG [Geobacter hydrogenophilus]GLI36576.1 preprotein translocase subunit SecG [Geobacter hydrogenophilus]
MTILLTILHILVCIALIAIVLLQSGKGAEMGASFGAGGSQSVFGAGGGTTFLSKLTTGAAIIFMLTSLTLAYLSGQSETSSIMPKGTVAPAPRKAAAPSTTQPAGTPQAPVQSTPAQQPSQRPSESAPQTK